MPQIGQFHRDASGFAGQLVTLTLNRELVIVPAEHSDAGNAPDYRVHYIEHDGPEVGAAWKRTGEKAGEYLSVLLDDPALRSRSVPTCPATTTPECHGRRTGADRDRAMSGTRTMRSRVIIALKARIPLFAGKPSHASIPPGCKSAGARSEGQGRPSAGASRVPLTAASALAGWWFGGERPARRHAALLLAGVLAVCAGSGVVVARSAPAARPIVADPHATHIAEASQRFGIPEHWIRAVLRAESAGDVGAISSAGAMGLMQVMPYTWAGLRVRYRLGRDPCDPRDNIIAGAAYLREMWDRYGNVAAMLAAYNAGPGRYDEYLSAGRTLPAGTRAYVAALVPVLDGSATSASPVAPPPPPPPPDWREASLFVTRPDDRRTVAAPSSEARPGDARVTVPVRDPADAEPQDGSIFVTRASIGDTP